MLLERFQNRVNVHALNQRHLVNAMRRGRAELNEARLFFVHIRRA